MEYAQGHLDRIFILKFDHKESFIPAIKTFLKKESIKNGVMFFIGALESGRMVTGPAKPVLPPVPQWATFKDGWEVFGMATIFQGDNGPAVHIHSASGKNQTTMVGCIRDQANVFLTIEAILYELKDIDVTKGFDELTGVHLLKFNHL